MGIDFIHKEGEVRVRVRVRVSLGYLSRDGCLCIFMYGVLVYISWFIPTHSIIPPLMLWKLSFWYVCVCNSLWDN